MPRRGENIYKRRDGRWEGRIPDGYYPDGRKRYRSIYAKTYTEVKEKIKYFEKMVVEPIFEKQTEVFNLQYIFDLWLQDNQYHWKDSTYACYKQMVECQILPAIGTIPASQFSNNILNEFILNKKKNTETLLSDKYIKNIVRTILQALKYVNAEYQYDIFIPSTNPISVDIAEKSLPDQTYINKLEKHLIHNSNNSSCLGILLCCYTGIRIGEVCALQWKDIDLQNGILSIKRTLQRVKIFDSSETSSKITITTPKTKRSVRQIPIPPIVLELLKENQKKEDDYLIEGYTTAYTEPRTLQYRFQSILRTCGIPAFNFHMLRHIFATRCIAIGFDMNSLSEILGHSNVQITLNLYVHSSNERKKYLMDQFNL